MNILVRGFQIGAKKCKGFLERVFISFIATVQSFCLSVSFCMPGRLALDMW